MPASLVPDRSAPLTGHGSLNDGTSPRVLMPGSGATGLSSNTAQAPDKRASDGKKVLQETLIDADGVLKDAKVLRRIAHTIERGKMAVVHGIIVHQTGGATAQSSLDSYKLADANGAHFLIDKDGTRYQTASVLQKTWHVGKLRARCLAELSCSPAEVKAYKRFDPSGMNTTEQAKDVPARYPSNADSIGIELVGLAVADPKKPTAPPVYEAVTDAQNASLKWLVAELTRLLGVPMTEVFRHPEVSWKNITEASTAKWQ